MHRRSKPESAALGKRFEAHTSILLWSDVFLLQIQSALKDCNTVLSKVG